MSDLGRAARVISVVTVVVMVACGDDKPAKTPSGGRVSCAADSDCVVTDTSHCCAPCLEAPRAIPSLAFSQLENKCAVVDCAPASDRIECPKVASKQGYVAKCSSGTCTAVRGSN